MKQYNIFQPFLLSFYSKPLYRDVGHNWRGIGLLYLLFLSAVLCFVSLYLYYAMSKTIAGHLEPLIAQLPTITVQQGKISIDKPTPYLIKTPNNNVIAVIDTSGQSNSLETTHAWILLTQDKLLIQRSANQTTSYDLSNLHNNVYTPEKVAGYMQILVPTLVGAIFVLTFLLEFIRNLVVVLLLAGIAKIFTHTTLTYKTVCRLGAIAITPALILATLLSLLYFKLPYAWLIYFPLTLAYLLYGIEANKKTTPQKQSAS